MDTRSKILTPAQALALAGNLRSSGRALTVVTGYFDPLRVEHAQLLASLTEPDAVLMVVIHSPADALLPAAGRAVLAAALDVVDHVVLAEPGESEAWVESLHARRIVREEAGDRRRTSDLIRYVHARQ